MHKKYEALLTKHFIENPFITSNIDSFNNFIDFGLQRIIDEMDQIEPTIIPHDVDEFKIKFDNIKVAKPMITEADGSERKIFPSEARLRNISYSAQVTVDVATFINGVQRESFTTTLGRMPIMLMSNRCHLNGLSKDEFIKIGEDPDDPGGYFIVNGTERVLISVEDLAPNHMLVEQASTGTSEYVGKIFSERGSYRIPHQIEQLKNGIFYITFTRMQRIPLAVVIKALGLLKDEDIVKAISLEEDFDEAVINLLNFVEIKTQDDALDYIAKLQRSTKPKDIRIQRTKETLDRYLLPHIGISDKDRMFKAYNLCKLLKKFIKVSKGEMPVDDKDHYDNKRLKLSGELLEDLFRTNLNKLVKDLLYNFQRIVKRGKFPSIKVIIRDKLMTNGIYSSMATGNWVGGRKGISQRIQRVNHLETISHLQRIVSPLSPSQENFEARALHPTHMGRLCPIETPEGTNIGLRKNLSLLAKVSLGVHTEEAEKTIDSLRSIGLRPIK
jgi:DNA-directed RNA polymerase subunit B